MDKIKVEHHHMRTGIMTPTYRIKNDFNDVIKIIDEIDDFKRNLDPKKVNDLILTAPGRKHCEKCIYRRFHENEYWKEKYQKDNYQPYLEGLFVKDERQPQELKQPEFARKRKKGERYLVLPGETVKI